MAQIVVGNIHDFINRNLILLTTDVADDDVRSVVSRRHVRDPTAVFLDEAWDRR